MIFQTRNQGNGKLPAKNISSDIIKDLVTHEVGHTLGLRHNFKASSWLKLSEINSKNPPAITSASVMDYNPVNFADQRRNRKGVIKLPDWALRLLGNRLWLWFSRQRRN